MPIQLNLQTLSWLHANTVKSTWSYSSLCSAYLNIFRIRSIFKSFFNGSLNLRTWRSWRILEKQAYNCLFLATGCSWPLYTKLYLATGCSWPLYTKLARLLNQSHWSIFYLILPLRCQANQINIIIIIEREWRKLLSSFRLAFQIGTSGAFQQSNQRCASLE